MDLTDTAAALAPHVDRLALCVHRPASRNEELRRTIDALRPPPQSVLVVAARLLVADGLRPGDLVTLNRYQPPSALAAIEQVHVDRGLLIDRGDGVREASAAFAAAAALVLRVQGEAATVLWGEPVEAAAAAEAVVATASSRVSGGGFPTFVRQVETRPTRETTAAAPRLLDAVTELRYVRADAHAAALARAGVRPRDAADLTRRWKGFGEPLPPTEAERRQAIEDDTNRHVADLLDGGTAGALLAALEPLPGDDPRPSQDR